MWMVGCGSKASTSPMAHMTGMLKTYRCLWYPTLTMTQVRASRALELGCGVGFLMAREGRDDVASSGDPVLPFRLDQDL